MNRTKTLSLVFAILALIASANRSGACEIVRVSPARLPTPSRDAVMASGVVEGYEVAAYTVGNIERAPSLRVRIIEVVEGNIVAGNAEIILLSWAPDCSRVPYQQERLQEWFPVGIPVVVMGRIDQRPSGSTEQVIITDEGNVGRIPTTVPRTSSGDLDFRSFDPNAERAYSFFEYEFARVLLKLAQGPTNERLARLENLAHYPRFAPTYDTRAREFYDQAISASGVSPSQARRLRALFEQVWKTQ